MKQSKSPSSANKKSARLALVTKRLVYRVQWCTSHLEVHQCKTSRVWTMKHRIQSRRSTCSALITRRLLRPSGRRRNEYSSKAPCRGGGFATMRTAGALVGYTGRADGVGVAGRRLRVAVRDRVTRLRVDYDMGTGAHGCLDRRLHRNVSVSSSSGRSPRRYTPAGGAYH